MKVTKKQAQANRVHIVETASALFKERGYDGIGIAELMGAAGFTQGGFYKHFESKADLMAEASACGLTKSVKLMSGASLGDFINAYLSREHRDHRASGCTLAALCGDAARKEVEVKAAFADGIEGQVKEFLDSAAQQGDFETAQMRAKILAATAQSIGAIVMSRACPDDSPLADEILITCRDALLQWLSKN